MSQVQSQEQFQQLIAGLTAEIAALPLNSALADHLNNKHGASSPLFNSIFAACQAGVKDGWMCKHEGGGIRYGRVIKATDATHGFSVDVVDMDNIAGPHHVHPEGEIDLIMPIEGDAQFDGRGAGWLVCPPASAHRPTVSQGRALVLYLLPKGEIGFTQ